MFITVELRNFVKTAAATLAVFAIIAVAAHITLPHYDAVSANSAMRAYTLVVDPGHGGMDGGAVSADGKKESDINLSIALKMEALSDFLGIDCVLTRDTDSDNSDTGSYSEHDSLVSRAELANSIENSLLISIHQNKFPNELVSGAEIMYADTVGSRELGLIVQDNMVLILDPENRRVARPAPSELLLTSSVKCPAILAECGFMSNPDELQRLSTSEYQLKIALVMMGSFIQFSSQQLPT